MLKPWESLKNLFRKLVGRLQSVFYVEGSQPLPPPLKPREEYEYLRRLREGDESVRTQLIERNLRLVVYIARKFDNTGVGLEDLISIGTIGLIKAVNTFDPVKKIKLATYASRCIENEILMHLRRSSRTRSEVSFDEPLNVDWDGNELLLSDILGTESDTVYAGIEGDVVTGRRGVDVVFEHVGAATWPASLRALAPVGRLVTCGATTGGETTMNITHLFAKQQSLLGSFMGTLGELYEVLPFVFRKQVHAVIDKVYPLAEIAAAHERLENKEQFGKIVLVP
jgi:RNA polymerase sigma factor (sigma-70 family)